MSAAPEFMSARFTFRVVETTPAHETMRVFVNGASAGLLTMRNEEAAYFRRVLSPPDLADEKRDANAREAMGDLIDMLRAQGKL